MNYDEFTEYKWMTISEIMSQYENEEIPILYPTLTLIILLKFLNLHYSELKYTA